MKFEKPRDVTEEIINLILIQQIVFFFWIQLTSCQLNCVEFNKSIEFVE